MFLSLILSITLAISPAPAPSTSDKDPYFAPGTSWRYSNTNYVVVGLLIEKLTGHAYGQEVARRILSPLKLTHTSVPGNRASLPTPHAHGYEPLPTDPPTMVDATRMDPSLDWAAMAVSVFCR